LRPRLLIKKIARFIGWLVTIVLILAVAITVLVSTPAVQSQLVCWAKGFLESSLDTRVEIDEVRAALPTEAVLKCVTMYDKAGLPAIEAEEIRLDVLNFSIWRFILKSKEKQSLTLDGLRLIRPRVFMYKSALDGQTNFKKLFSRKKKKKTSKPLQLDIDIHSVTIEKGVFLFADSTDSRVFNITPGVINYKNIAANQLNGELAFRYFTEGRLEADIHYLSGVERHSGFELDRLRTDFTTDTVHRWIAVQDCYETEPFVRFNKLNLDAGNTRLRGSLAFFNETFTQVIDTLADNDRFVLNLLDGSKVDFASIDFFTPKQLPLQGVVTVSGSLRGSFQDMEAIGLKASYLDSTWVDGDVKLTNITDGEKLWMDIGLRGSSVSFKELNELLPKVNFPLALRRLGRLDIDGSFLGHYYDFETKTSINTRQGSAYGDIHLILPPYAKTLTYNGSLETKNLNLDAIGLGNGNISKGINFNGKVEGSGVNLAELNTRFDAYITDSWLLGYKLDSVYANLLLKDLEVAGLLRVDDTEGKADLFIDLNLAKSPKLYTVNGSIEHVDLKHYNILKEQVYFSTAMDLDFEGDSLENADGLLTLLDAALERRIGDSLDIFKIPGLSLGSRQLESGNKRVELKSVLADGYLEGDFTLKKALDLTKRLTKEAGLFFKNNDSLTIAYYTEKKADSTAIDNVNVDFEIVTEDSINLALDYLKLPAFLSPNSSLDGFIDFSDVENAKVNIVIDSGRYRNIQLKHADAVLDLIKDATSDYVVLQAKANSGLLRLGERFALDTVIFDGNIESGKDFDKLVANLYSEQEDGLNRINLKGDAKFLRSGAIETRLDSANSWLLLDNIEWDFNTDHMVAFIGSHIDVDNLVLHTKGQAIGAQGLIGKEKEDRLAVTGIDLNMSLLNDFFTLPYQFDGNLNATVNLDALMNKPLISAEGLIIDFTMDNYRYGDLMVNSAWDRLNDKLNMEAELIHADDSKIKLQGAYRLKQEAPLDFELITEGAFPLAYVYPFVKTQFYNIDGKVDLQDFTITGSLSDMIVLGKGEIKDAHIGVDFFQTEYDFGGKVNFTKNAIRFNEFIFVDKNKKKAHLGGEIRHRGFRDIFFDMKVDRVNDFLVLDTDKEDNPTYNGTIYIDDATASVVGPIDQIKITAKGTSGAGSVLRIPLSEETTIERPDFVRFTGEKTEERRKVKTGFDGFELNLTVQAKPESEVELIFDEKVGDIMRGRGEGTITLNVNEQGEFAMFGDFRVTEGDYLFTAQNIVNKRFEVVEGGTITWSGDPYEARLDLDAIYPVYADIQDFLPDVNRPLRTKVNVVMHLDGILLQPEITLDIEIGNLNEMAAINLSKYLRSIRYDQQELNKQVFSLMVFKRFAIAGQETNVNTIGSEGVTSSISELLSNQFNYWLGQALGDNVNIGVGTNTFRDIDVRISAVLFNDRVTIERDGALVAPDQNFSLGNISVIIRLTDPNNTSPGNRPGELVMEVFTRENFDFSTNQTQRTNQTGLGLYYKKDLDRLLGDLFKKREQ
jgi:hypothetical protein